MIKRVKKWLGIEGVQAIVDLQSTPVLSSGKLVGTIHVYSKHAETIEKIHLRLIEKYARGRGSSKLIDEYTLGEEWLTDTIQLAEEDQETLEFTLFFEPALSEMDSFENKNVLTRQLGRVAKLLKKVKSSYRLELELVVKDRAINPVVTTEVLFQ